MTGASVKNRDLSWPVVFPTVSCTGFRGSCGNIYIRQEQLADLLGGVMSPIPITPEVADGIAAAGPNFFTKPNVRLNNADCLVAVRPVRPSQ